MSGLSPSIRAIAKGSVILFVGLLLSKALFYIYRVIIARYLGSGDYGLIAISLAFLEFMFILANLGLSAGIIRYVPYFRGREDYARLKGVITTTLKVVIPISVGISAIIFIFSDMISVKFFRDPELSSVLRIIIIALPFWALLRITVQVFYSFKKAEYVAAIDLILKSVVLVGLTVVLLMAHLGVVGAAVAYTITIILTSVLALFYLEKKLFPIFRTKIVSIKMRGELFRYSFPLFLESFVTVVLKNTDTLMLGYFLTMEEVGIYNAAMPTAKLLFLFSGILIPMYLPVLSELYSKNQRREFNETIGTVARWIFLSSLPFFLIMVLFPTQVLSILFGSEYSRGSAALLILSIGIFVFVTVGTVNRPVLSVYKMTKLLLYITLGMSVLNVISNYFLIPFLGIEGAAVATSLSYILGAAAYYVMGYRTTGRACISPIFLRIALSGILSVTPVYLILDLFVSSRAIPVMVVSFGSFVVLYATFLRVTKAYVEEDIELLKALKSKIERW
jgi:O-antigen/teichoic acid export membrane protein